MGEVYRARDTRLERSVAIKVLPQHLSASPEVRQRFEREAKTISQLSHSHICALYDVGNQDGVEYLVMELLEGRDARGSAGEGLAAARADAPVRDGDRRRAGQGAPAGDRASGPEARQRDADEVGREAARLRSGQGDDGTAAVVGGDVVADGDGLEPEPDAGRDDPGDVPVHGPGAARGERGRRADGHLRVRVRPVRDGDGTQGVFRSEPGVFDLVDHEGGAGADLGGVADGAGGSGSGREALSRQGSGGSLAERGGPEVAS